MKQIWPDYSYSPATNVLTLTGLNIDRDQLLLVAAPERGRIMYNFADSSVTASAFTSGANTSLTLVATTAGLTTTAALVIYYDDQLQSTSVSISNLPSTQTIAGTVTVGSLPAISGTVTANLSSSNLNTVTIGVRGSVTVGNTTQITDNVVAGFNNTFGNNDTLKVDIRTPDGSVLDGEASVPVQGTVNIGSLPAISGTVTVGNSVTIASLPSLAACTAQIGSVTASISNSVTIASFATSVTARLINPAGTAVTYAEVGTAGSPSIDVLSVQGVTSGTAIPISISSVTIGSLPAISGTVTVSALPRPTWTNYSGTAVTAFTAITAISTTTRSYLLAQVTTGQMFLNIGATATTLNSVYFSAGQGFAWETSVPQGIVSIISTVTGTNYVLKEG